MDKQLFIKTTCKDTYELLVKENFTLLSFDGKVWTFLNDKGKAMNFNSKEIVYSDKLCF